MRAELRWREAPSEDGALLVDPLTGREFALSRAQAVLLQTFAGEQDLARTAAIASDILDLDVEPDLVAELLAAFAELALFVDPDASCEQLRERQREARRRHFEDTRLAKLQAMLPRLRALPYYARTLPEPLPAVESMADLARLPRLGKPDLRAHFSELLPASLPGEVRWMSTSGTTGERQQVARSQLDWEASQPWTWGLNHTIRDALGARYCRLTTPFCDGSECHLRGASRAERTQGRRLVLESGLDIASFAPERIERMARELVEHEPAYVLADPAYLALFADQALRLRLRLPRLRFVLTAYELSSALHRRTIERAFECPVFDAYGATEYGAVAVQCEAGRYHVNPECFIVEVADVEGGAGELVITSLDKQLMPLLRYATGDLARPADSPCSCAWSETDTLLSLEGRTVDVVHSPEGARITAGAVDRAVAPVAAGIVSYALIQRSPTSYRLELLPGEDFDRTSIAAIEEALRVLLGPAAQLRIDLRRELLPAASGKFRLAHAEARAR